MKIPTPNAEISLHTAIKEEKSLNVYINLNISCIKSQSEKKLVFFNEQALNKATFQIPICSLFYFQLMCDFQQQPKLLENTNISQYQVLRILYFHCFVLYEICVVQVRVLTLVLAKVFFTSTTRALVRIIQKL